MTSTTQIRPPQTARGPEQPPDLRPGEDGPAAERPAVRDMLGEILPLVGSVPFYGPPVIFLLGPWVFLVLMLAGPFAFLVVLVAGMIVAAAILAALAAAVVAICSAPFRIVRHMRRHRARHVSISVPAARGVAIESPRVAI